MKFLIDTNIWLELFLEQEKAGDVRNFFENTESNLLGITEFTIYSIGIILSRLGKEDIFEDFLSDTVENSGVERICLNISDIKQMISVQKKFFLDFDDAYQYIAAKKYGLVIISFDKDFDKTGYGRKTPEEILKTYIT